MTPNDQEIEAKFYISDLPALRRRLEALGAQCQQERIFEANLRFDSPGSGLSHSYQVLRLRKDSVNRLTYKGPDLGGEVHIRQEIEFEVSDFDAARRFLEALGFSVMMAYEKYRAAYLLDGLEITLDEMPYGNFSEIEGGDPAAIHRMANALGLNWEKQIPAGYVVLFDQLKNNLGLGFRDLTFENFASLAISAADLGVSPADAA